MSRHAGDDAADARPAAEVLADPSDHRRLPAGRLAVAKRCQHGEQDVAALGEGVGGHSITVSARRRTAGGIVRPISRAVRRLRVSSILS